MELTKPFTPRGAHAYEYSYSKPKMMASSTRKAIGSDPSFFPQNISASKRRVPCNINYYDSNILGLPAYVPSAEEAKASFNFNQTNPATKYKRV